MRRLGARLSRKFAIGTAVGLFVSSLVFLLLFLALYRAELSSERASTAQQVNQLLQTSLENAMLKRDLAGLRLIVERLGRQPGIEAVFITNPRGEIRFASQPALLGTYVPLGEQERKAFTHFVSPQTGPAREVLRSVNPVPNRAACRECHGPTALNPINGVLYVDYDAAPIRGKAQTTTLLLMGSGAIIVLLNLAGGWWFMRKYVLAPVGHLTRISGALARGDLSQRAEVDHDDELGDLGRTFNRMADQLEERIQESEHQRRFLQALIDAIPDGVRVIDADYSVVLTNRAYREQLGLGEDDGVGDMCYRVSHQADKPCPATLITCPVHEIPKSGQAIRTLHRHHDTGGTATDVEIYAAPLRVSFSGEPRTMVVESIRDLSKQINYSHEQKLSELGKLATGVAHEIHNPLASVRLALDGFRQSLDHVNPEVAEYLELVDQEIDKCLAFTERLLRLGMRPSDQPELVELARIVDDTLNLVRWEADQLDVSLVQDMEPGLRVLASDSELRMVMLNLTQNAFHAMPKGGRLEVTGKADDPWVEIAVRDTGTGIEAERLVQIFDPFYSRRADGAKGTGLGLSIVRTIVENYGGRIDVQSDIGIGSVFTVRLPNAATASGMNS